MIIEATKPFEKSFKKLSKIDQIAVKIALGKFTIDPYDPSLKNHALKGKFTGARAISARHDLRVLYEEEGDHTIVYLIKTGKHNQVY